MALARIELQQDRESLVAERLHLEEKALCPRWIDVVGAKLIRRAPR